MSDTMYENLTQLGGGGEVPAGADECVYCLREIAFGAEFCPLAPEASRQADGPKVHPQCWDLFFADTSRGNHVEARTHDQPL